MRSPDVFRKLLLLPLALAVGALLIQACATNEGSGPYVWPARNQTVTIRPPGTTDDEARRKAFTTALVTCKALEFDVSFYSKDGQGVRRCHTIKQGVPNPASCPVKEAIHAAQRVRFASQADLDCFLAALGLQTSGK